MFPREREKEKEEEEEESAGRRITTGRGSKSRANVLACKNTELLMARISLKKRKYAEGFVPKPWNYLDDHDAKKKTNETVPSHVNGRAARKGLTWQSHLRETYLHTRKEGVHQVSG